MTELIRQQLISMILMISCGIASGLTYQVFFQLRLLRAKSIVADFILEVVSLILTGYCITVFLYYSSHGNIRLQDVVCFFTGLWLWRKVYGEKGEQATGVRKESQGAGHQYSTGVPEAEEKGKKDQAGRRRGRNSRFHRRKP